MLTPRKSPARVVVKLGTGVLTSGVGRLNTARIASVCAQIAALRATGITPTPLREYFDRLVEFALAAEWGKREIPRSSLTQCEVIPFRQRSSATVGRTHKELSG